MINRVCDICKEYTNDVWVIVLSDNKEKVEISGHKSHIDDLHNKIKNVKDSNKKTAKQILKEIGYKQN
jgi:formylmethanofuran dehydrogenase subunit B